MRTSVITLALGGSLLACSSNTRTPEITPDPVPLPSTVGSTMAANDRCDAVRELMVDTIVNQLVAPQHYNYGRYGYDMGSAGLAVAVDRASKPDDAKMAEPQNIEKSPSGGTAGPSHYTTTNVQERGVDEGDLVKTDGKYIYTIRNGELIIAKTWPVEATELAARVKFKNFAPQQLYVHEDDVIVTGVATDAAQGATRVAVIDVKDRSKPKLDRMFDVDGHAASSRVIGSDLYLVQNTALQIPQTLYPLAQAELAKFPRADQQSLRPWEIQSRIAKTLRAKLLANLSTDDVVSALPKIRSNGATIAMKCSDLYVAQDNVQLGLTALARISIDNQDTDLVGAMVTGAQVYASTDNVYVSAPAYTWNQQGHASYATQVHKFSLSQNDGRPTYVASGSVEGQVLNQFSMSEHNGDLRIATTDWDWQGGQGGNHLFVLRANERSLKTIGAIRGLAKGERIYSGRMFGEKGYIVTFRQTDPLFTLDLSDPRNPRVAGELKINGFSNYIHPMGGDLLLAIGQDANDQGRTTGFHMQVFDVSDPSKPTRRFHEKLSKWSSYSSSAAEQDHHAFTYDPTTGTLALPVAGNTDEGEQFSGLVVYNIDRKRGFTLHGRVTHRGLASEMLDAACGKLTPGDPWNYTTAYGCDDNSRAQQIAAYSRIDRSMVLDKYIVSFGAAGMEIRQLDHLSSRAARLRWPLPTTETSDLVVLAK